MSSSPNGKSQAGNAALITSSIPSATLSAADAPDILSAAAKVFAIPEVLETILLELPEVDLLLAQRISKEFRDMIKNSLNIQRKLFFEQLPADDEGEIVKVNPLLDLMFHEEIWWDHEDNLCNEFVNKCSNSAGGLHMVVHLPIVDISKEKLEGDESRALDPAQMYEHASWRRMWATQPAIPVHPIAEYLSNHADEVPAARMGPIMEILRDPGTLQQSIFVEPDGFYDDDFVSVFHQAASGL